jgi:catechol 2,3-dioxygenase-like lactoylglutathione lyase family enzyme
MPARIEAAALDHVAVAVERWSDAWPRYAIELGGTWSSGGLNVGFGPAQLRYANGGRVEILQPWRPQDNPFLRRFLDGHGPGPHHLTFKVPDLAAALDLARDAGLTPVGVDMSAPDWKEAFLHPRQATGIVVQLAQAAYAWESPPPEGFPTARPGPPASLLRVTHAVSDLGEGLALFEGLLGGRRVAGGEGPDQSWDFADLEWPGPPILRLVAPHLGTDTATRGGPLGTWLGVRPGRLHHLAFAIGATPEGPGGSPALSPDAFQPRTDVPGVFPGDGPTQVLEPGDNLGTRLVVIRPNEGIGT